MTIFLPLLQFNNLTGLGLFATLCHSPNPIEFMLIGAAVTAMVGGLVVLVPASAVTMVIYGNHNRRDDYGWCNT